MKKKSKFCIGDLVRHKVFKNGVGEVAEIDVIEDVKAEIVILVKWPNEHPKGEIKNTAWVADESGSWKCRWHTEFNLELAETPIERMKRLYSEDI